MISFAGSGVFSSANTVEYSVTADGSGNIAGVMGTGTQVLAGLTVASAAVPEPGSLVMLGLGLVGMLAYRRRRVA